MLGDDGTGVVSGTTNVLASFTLLFNLVVVFWLQQTSKTGDPPGSCGRILSFQSQGGLDGAEGLSPRSESKD